MHTVLSNLDDKSHEADTNEIKESHNDMTIKWSKNDYFVQTTCMAN